MRSSPLLGALLSLPLLLAAPPVGAQGSQAEKREKLLKKLGLEPTPPESGEGAPPPSDAAPGDDEPDAGGPDDGAPASGGSDDAVPRAGAPARPPKMWFTPRVHTLLLQRCQRCHQPGKSAAKTGFALVGDAAADYEASLLHVNRSALLESRLLTAGLGVKHRSKAIARGSDEEALLVGWLRAGAPFAPSSAPKAEAPAAADPAENLTAPKPVVAETKDASAPPKDPPALEVSEPSAPSAPIVTADVAAPVLPFTPTIHALLTRACVDCHAADPTEATDGYRVHEDAARHFASARALVVPGQPEQSRLYLAALGVDHGGDVVLEKGGADAKALARWIADGANETSPQPPVGGEAGEGVAIDGSGVVVDGSGVANVEKPAPADVQREAPLLSPKPALDAMAAAFPLLEGLSLHGRFDLNYERRGFTDNPLDGKDALRSYHHFVFLSRRTKSDPFGLDVELTSLQFWELSARASLGPFSGGVKLGKVLVPFGAEPTFHASYGGLAGFDQKLLPPVWAQEGVSLFGQVRALGIGVTADAYAVRGYRLRDLDSELSLQADFAPLEDIKPGFGARLGVSYGPLRAWYSAYANPLHEERLLFLQAFDVGFYRWRGVPVLSDVAVSLGALRGDVSGGGAGKDYYHFGSYFQLRYYPFDWLYLQYRQGLRTFGNQRGLFLDEHSLTADDASTHSLGAQVSFRGLSFGVWQFWNLEKVNEVDDDFFRVTVAYAF